jgi:hypothetical protein
MQNISNNTKAAIKKYGIEKCVWAFERHNEYGEGANTIGFHMKFTTNQADAAINAGRELSLIGA